MEKRQLIAISSFVSDRTPRSLSGPSLRFDLAAELALLHDEPNWKANGHNARSLLKQGNLRLVLLTLRAGKHVHDHPTSEPLAIQPLSGSVRVHIPNEAAEIGPQQLMSVAQDVAYGIEALEDSALLIWVGSDSH
jgi:hypothetical protein